MTELTRKVNTLLAEREQKANLRKLECTKNINATTISINGKELINFASNDYLGLSHHPFLKERAIKAIEKYGVGNPSSRFVSGNCELYSEIEYALAHLKGTEAALIFPNGFQANLTILHALSKLDSFFFCDKLSHSSILLGAQFSKRNFKRFAHNNLDDIKNLISKEQNKNKWIITESIFSMDGDLAPIDDLLLLSKTNNTYFYLDEAHATGVFGKNGMGLLDSPNERTIIMGTFGKGCGSFGAYIACSQTIKEYLINFCAGLIYTTALPPPVLASIQAALEIIPHMVSERQTLLKNAHFLKTELEKIGFDTGNTKSQIICLYLGSNELALSLCQYLEENHIYARAIRPPTVPVNTARVRLSLSLGHSNLEIEQLINTLKCWYANKR
jgi:8-amino-7-oxononanoate synthase